MHLIKCRHNECWLASLCMLAGLNQQEYERASDLVVACTGNTWGDWASCGTNNPIHTIMRALVPAFPQLRAVEPLVDAWKGVGLYSDALKPDLTAQGILYIVWKSGNGHATPYENGILYDPALGQVNWHAFVQGWKDRGYHIAKFETHRKGESK